MNIREESLAKHYEWKGKIEVVSRVPINDRHDLSLAYTPGVAEACMVIHGDVDKSYELTRRANLVAVITDGTANVCCSRRLPVWMRSRFASAPRMWMKSYRRSA